MKEFIKELLFIESQIKGYEAAGYDTKVLIEISTRKMMQYKPGNYLNQKPDDKKTNKKEKSRNS